MNNHMNCFENQIQTMVSQDNQKNNQIMRIVNHVQNINLKSLWDME